MDFIGPLRKLSPLAVLVLVSSCGDGGGAGTPGSPAMVQGEAQPGVQLARDVVPILASGCGGEYCHGRTMMTARDAYTSLVGQPSIQCDDGRPLVAPGDPDHSYLMDKILGRNLCAGYAMPRGMWHITPDEIRTLRDWIAEGAPND
jgi:hypothetical protein